MSADYLVVAGRMTRERLESHLAKGYFIRSWRTKGTESVALIYRTPNSVVPGWEQQQRLYRAGYVGVHLNPTETTIKKIVYGALTCDTSQYDVAAS